MVKSVPKTLYSPNSRKKQPMTIRNVARAVALRFDSTVISTIRQSQREGIDEPNTNARFHVLIYCNVPSVITLKPAICDHFKTGHRDWPKT